MSNGIPSKSAWLLLGALLGPVSFVRSAPPSDAPVIIIGVLEPMKVPSSPAGDYRTLYNVRVVFRKKAGRWEALPHDVPDSETLVKSITWFPKEMNWTIAYHGRSLGRFKSRRWAHFDGYSDIGLHEPEPLAKLPRVTDGADDFAGWLGPTGLRPLVVVSGGRYADPDQWQAARLPAAPRAALEKQFRSEISRESACETETGERRSLGREAVRLASQAHRSRNEEWLAVIGLDPAQPGMRCEGPRDEEWAERLYYLRGREVQRLGAYRRVLDAGDYDGDGSSEVIVKRSGYNLDGYELYWDSFKRKAEFSWSYH